MIVRARGRTVVTAFLFATVVAGASASSAFDSFHHIHALVPDSPNAMFPADQRSKFLAYVKRQRPISRSLTRPATDLEVTDKPRFGRRRAAGFRLALLRYSTFVRPRLIPLYCRRRRDSDCRSKNKSRCWSDRLMRCPTRSVHERPDSPEDNHG
jgi:hypothetical protein